MEKCDESVDWHVKDDRKDCLDAGDSPVDDEDADKVPDGSRLKSLYDSETYDAPFEVVKKDESTCPGLAPGCTCFREKAFERAVGESRQCSADASKSRVEVVSSGARCRLWFGLFLRTIGGIGGDGGVGGRSGRAGLSGWSCFRI